MKSIWEINLGGDLFNGLENVLGGLNGLERQAGEVETSLNNAFDGNVVDSWGSKVWGARQVWQGFSDIFNQINAGQTEFLSFDKAAHELKSIADVSEEVMDKIKSNSLSAAWNFGGDAEGHLKTYQVLLSKLGPELADKPEILKSMGDNAALLSKVMEGDAVGAANLLSAAMNQYEVSIENPEEALAAMNEMMNQMQAGANAGSAELPELKNGIEAVGSTAKSAGLSFAEMNAALQLMDKAGRSGAEGGTTLRNALAIMTQDARTMSPQLQKLLSGEGVDINVLSDKTLTFSQRLRELSKIKNDGALVEEMFGRGNMAAGQYMLNNIGILDEYTASIIENKDAAIKSANENMSAWTEKLDRMGQGWKNFKISFWDVMEPVIPLTQGVGGALETILGIAPGLQAMGTIWKEWQIGLKLVSFWENVVTVATVAWTVATELLSMAFGTLPIGWIMLGIGAVVGSVVLAWNKFEGFRKAVFAIWESIKTVFVNIGKFIGGLFGMDVGEYESVGEAWGKGAAKGAESFKNSKKEKESKQVPEEQETTPTLTAQTEINKPLVPNPNPTNSGAKPSALDSSKGSDAKQGGRNVAVQINNLVGKIEIHTNNLREGVANAKRQVADGLLAAVSDFETGIAQQ